MVSSISPVLTCLPRPVTLMMRCSGLFNIALRLVVACALTLSAVVASAATILVHGDSLSAGYGLPGDKSWVNLLAARLHDERFDYKVANASISGETTLGGRNRIEPALKVHRPDIVILALGVNDGLRGGSLDAMRANLEAIVDALRRSKARVLLVGMRLPPNYGADYTEKFNRVFGEVAGTARRRSCRSCSTVSPRNSRISSPTAYTRGGGAAVHPGYGVEGAGWPLLKK